MPGGQVRIRPAPVDFGYLVAFLGEEPDYSGTDEAGSAHDQDLHLDDSFTRTYGGFCRAMNA